MPQAHSSYPLEFWQQMVELGRGCWTLVLGHSELGDTELDPLFSMAYEI